MATSLTTRRHRDLEPLAISPASFEAPPAPGARVRLGSPEHKRLLSRMMLDSHDAYRPALIHWPELDSVTRDRIVSLPIWDIAVQTEGRASMNVKTFNEQIQDPLLHEAIGMNAYEERRHKIVLADMVQAYGIELSPEPAYVRPRDPEFRVHAYRLFGMHRPVFFGFGLFKLAKDTGFFPDELIDTFEPVMREEGRHILFFVNWVAWWRATMPWWRRPYFEAKVLLVWAFLIGERISMAKGMGKDNTKAQENNFTLNGSKDLGVEVSLSRTGGDLPGGKRPAARTL